MRKLLLTAILTTLGSVAGIAQVAPGLKDSIKDFPRSQLQPQITRPISIELNQSVRGCYEALGAMAGLNVVFTPDVRSDPVSFKLQDVDILVAFDALSLQTHNFIEVLDRRTIVVAPDNQTARRMFQTNVLETVPLNNAATQADVTSIITALRRQLNLSFIAQSTDPKMVLFRDTPDKVIAAERMIAVVDKAKSGEAAAPAASRLAFDVLGSLLIPDGAGVRKVRPARSQLQPKQTGLLSFNTNDDSRTTYETLAKTGGLNILFDPDFRSAGPLPFKLNEVELFDALDYLGLQTSSYWQVLNSNTIWVAPDNQTNRRQNENFILETIYLPPTTTSVKMTETITALRTILNASYIAQSTKAHAILIRDTPTKIALAEKIVTDFNSGPGKPPLQNSAVSSGSVNLTGQGPSVRAWAPAAVALDLKVTRPISINTDQNVRTAYSTLAAIAGVNVVFDDAFTDSGPRPFKLDNVNILDALDFLGMETRTFWEVIDAKTIIVAPDNTTNRRRLTPVIERTFALTNATGSTAVTEIITALRTLLNLSQIESHESEIMIRDSAGRIAVAQKIIADLDKPVRQ
jgi:hypothetical protein